MKIPSTWNDRSLLQDEPFLSEFKDYVPEKRMGGIDKHLHTVVNILKGMDIDHATEQWFKFILFNVPGEGPSRPHPEPKDYAALLFFVRVYSHLACDNVGAAFAILNRERQIRGLSQFKTLNQYEKALASHLASATKQQKKKKSSTKPDGPYHTRQLSNQAATVPLTPAMTKRKGGHNVPLISQNESSNKSVRPLEQVRKVIGKRFSDGPNDRPSKRRSTAKSHTSRSDHLANGKASKNDGPQTLPKTPSRTNPSRSTRYVVQPNPPSRDEQEQGQTTNNALGEHTAATVNTVTDGRTPTTKCNTRTPALPVTSNLCGVDSVIRLMPQKRTLDSPSDTREFKRRGIDNIDSNTVPGSTIPLYIASLVETCDKISELSVPIRNDILNKDSNNRDSMPSASPKKISVDGMPAGHFKYLVTKTSLPSTTVPEDARQLDPLCVAKADSHALLPTQQPHFPLPHVPYKKPLPELPPIWAQSRQEVCESFDWFRSYQGGVYHAHEMVKGYLLSGFPSSRDRFEHGGRLIISHGGGRAESIHTTKGQMSSHPASDQLAQDKSIRALLNNHRNGRPLVLLIDDKYALFPYDLGCKDITYAVLGFYTVAHVWAEYQLANNERGRVVRYKFAFRWCEDQGSPWWLTEIEKPGRTITIPDNYSNGKKSSDARVCAPVHSELSITSPPGSSHIIGIDQRLFMEQDADNDTRLCTSCCNPSPRIFHHHWACLVPECIMFWRQTEGPCIGDYICELTYHPRFLELPPHKPLPFGFQDIVKSLTKSDVGAGTLRNYHITRGFHCKKCGRLSSRSQWEKWECLNCHEYLTISIPLHLASDIWNQALPLSYRDYYLNPISDIVPVSSATFNHDAGRGIISSFILPHNRGKIHHIQPGNPRGRREADKIFLDYQEQATSGTIKFRRWPLRAHKCRGSLLTNYFSHNAGEPYKYVGGDANTVPFESAPAVCSARSLIEKRMKQALDIPIQFNEVLSAAYMERQKMAFHSDNEVGLGPVVSGLSLGSPAVMHFRLHSRFDPEREKRGILLSIVLRHGDVLVMDGAGVQECYEHTVVPNNFRIAATARQIGVTRS